MHPYIFLGITSIVSSLALILVALWCNMCYQVCICILWNSNEFTDNDTFELTRMDSVAMNIHDIDGL
jgi:hypothetical protein